MSRLFASLFCFVVITTTALAAAGRTLQSFGVTVHHGQPVRPYPANVALGLYDPDPLLDLACYTDGKIQVWRNQGDGTFGNEPVFERRVNSEVAKMEWRKSRMLTGTIFDRNSWGDLALTYANGNTETISHEWMAKSGISFTSVPQMKNNFPPLDFREVWRSSTQTEPSTFMALDDIDRDGRLEIAYSFSRQFSDSTLFVVYRCVGADSFVTPWDTVVEGAYGPFTISDVDNDGHKEIVLGKSGQPSSLELLESVGPGQYKLYQTNIYYSYPPFKVVEADIDHNGRKELVLHTSNPSPAPGQDATFISIAEFTFKSSTTMFFSIQTARYSGYTFDMAIGQVDGTGRDEIIPAGGSFGVNEPVPIDYLWYNGSTWITRSFYTGLSSGTTAPMFVNLDADTMKELFIGGVGPIGHGSCYALKYVSDTTWSVLWADSSLRNTPLSVNAGALDGQFIVAGANTVDRSPLDTLYSQLHVYRPSGEKIGIWQRDTASIQNFQILDVDNNSRSNLVAPVISHLIPDHLAVYEYLGSTHVDETVPFRTFELSQNYPNPFNPVTVIKYTIGEVRGQLARHALPFGGGSEVRPVVLKVFDVLGREVATLVNEPKAPGEYSVRFDASGLASGVYLYRLQAGGYKATRKLLFLR